MCFDRFSSRLFAACTDNNIYEFLPALKSTIPSLINFYLIGFNFIVCRYKGAIINSTYIRCKTSPISDHLLCGSNTGSALLWDLKVPY